jgi:hypothetical protein
MRFAYAFLVALMVVLLVFSVPLALRDAPYSVHNRDADGSGAWLEDRQLAGAPVRLQSGPLSGLAASDALAIIGPRLPYSKAEAVQVRDFLTAGGRVLLADDVGTGRSLLAALDIGVAIGDGVTSISYDRAPAFPIVASTGALALPAEMALSRPHVVLGAGVPVLRAHPYSWLDRAGEILIVGDPDLVTPAGSRLAPGAAEVLWQWLADGRDVVFDEGHRARTDPVGVAPVLSGEAGGRVVLVSAIGVAVALWIGFRIRIERQEPPRRRVVASKALEELPP